MQKWLDNSWCLKGSEPKARSRKINWPKTILTSCRRVLIFFPGAFLIALGAMIVIEPKVAIGVLVATLFFCGTLLCILAWRIREFGIKVEKLVADFGQKIHVHRVEVHPGRRSEMDSDDEKIIFH